MTEWYPERVVVCAALRYGAFLVVGPRHFDHTMHAQISAAKYAMIITSGAGHEQGFIDQYGVFMDRKEALAVATKAKQIDTRRPKSHPLRLLFSEDLY